MQSVGRVRDLAGVLSHCRGVVTICPSSAWVAGAAGWVLLLPRAGGDVMPPSRSGSSGPPGCQGGDHHESGLTCLPLSALTAATLRTPAPSTVIMTRATDEPLNSTLPDSGPVGWWPVDTNGGRRSGKATGSLSWSRRPAATTD